MKNSDFSLIVTVGPATLNIETLKEINQFKRIIFRLNGAHISCEDALYITRRLREVNPDAKIMMDLPGNKVRLVNLAYPISVTRGKKFSLFSRYLNYPSLYKHLAKGDTVYSSDGTVNFTVESVNENSIEMVPHEDGELLPKKGLHVSGINEELPFLFDKDLRLIEAACSLSLDYLSLSFVRDKNDILEAKELLRLRGTTNLDLIAKIETSQAIINLTEILNEVNIINIDRGDLSAEIGMDNLPAAQDYVIQRASEAEKKIFLATQFLKSMESYPIPLIAELIDLHKTIASGVNGIQLSEETAIGKYPLACIKKVFGVYERIVQKAFEAPSLNESQ